MDSRVRALDLKTGEVLWKALVDAPAVALPAVYEYKGKQYVVFAAGGNSILTPQGQRRDRRLRPARLTSAAFDQGRSRCGKPERAVLDYGRNQPHGRRPHCSAPH